MNVLCATAQPYLAKETMYSSWKQYPYWIPVNGSSAINVKLLWHQTKNPAVPQLDTICIIFSYKNTSEVQSPRTSFPDLGAWATFEFKLSNALRSTWADKFFRRKWNKAIWWKLYCAVPCHSRYFTFTSNFFQLIRKNSQVYRLFVIIIHLFICSTVICKDIILEET